MRTWRQKRRWIYGYAKAWNLSIVLGFSPRLTLPLGKPARKQLLHDQENLHARGLLEEKDVDGTWNTATDKIAFPPQDIGEKVMALAAKEIGTVEKPFGSNRGTRVEYYQRSTGAYYQAWCASFCWKMWQNAGYKGSTSAGAWDSTDSHGKKVSLKDAKPGDLVSLNVGKGHVGLLVRVNKNSVTLIAGNTSNSVKEKDYSKTIIHSICRPVA